MRLFALDGPPRPAAWRAKRQREQAEVYAGSSYQRVNGYTRLDSMTPDPDIKIEPEEADDDNLAEEPLPPGTLRPERDGFVRVWRRPKPALAGSFPAPRNTGGGAALTV